MDLLEFNTHSFIVKIWLEEPAERVRRAKWRGHITHVPSGDRRYLKSLWEILAFIAPYMVAMGVKVNILWRAQEWLAQRRRKRFDIPPPAEAEAHSETTRGRVDEIMDHKEGVYRGT